MKSQHVLKFDEERKIFKWIGNKPVSILKNEITANLWMLIFDNDGTINGFTKFISLLEKCSLWPDNISLFLPKIYLDFLSKYSFDFISNEQDLENKEYEINKLWLDFSFVRPERLYHPIPKIKLESTEANYLIEEIEYHERNHSDFYYRQECRNIYHFPIRFIVERTREFPFSSNDISKLFKLITKPYVVWSTYETISDLFPEVIPLLLLDQSLFPIALKLLDNLQLNSQLILKETEPEKILIEKYEKQNELWLECFKIVLERISEDKNEYSSKIIFEILSYVVRKTFKQTNNKNSIISHNIYKKRYDEILIILSGFKTKTIAYHGDIRFNQRLIPPLLPDIFVAAKQEKLRLPFNEFLRFEVPSFDLKIELLRICNGFLKENFIQLKKENLIDLRRDIVLNLKDYIQEYYGLEEMEIWKPYEGKIKKFVSRGFASFGFEIIDWAYLYLHFGEYNLINEIDKVFTKNFDIKKRPKKEEFFQEDKEKGEKLKTYLKSLILAFINIHEKKLIYRGEGFSVEKDLSNLEELIIKHAKSNNELNKNRSDLFIDRFYGASNNVYYQRLSLLLFNALNYLSPDSQKSFVSDYFGQSKNIWEMLSAVNRIKSERVRNKISELIEQQFDAKKYRPTIAEAEQVLIESINSEKHWQIAEPLFNNLQDYFEKHRQNDEDYQDFLFRVKLFLAFKKKKLRELEDIEVPEFKYRAHKYNEKGEMHKAFFNALFHIYHTKEYKRAIEKLESLINNDKENVEYAFYLFYSKSHLSFKEKNKDFIKAKLEWDNFLYNEKGELKNLKVEQKQELVNLEEPIESLYVHYYSHTNDYTRFLQAVNKLSDSFLYHKDIIKCVYDFYNQNGMIGTAENYVNNASVYYEDNELQIPDEIKKIRSNRRNTEVLQNYQSSLSGIRSLLPEDLAIIVPDNLKYRQNILNKFILSEIVQALKITLIKIKSVEEITKENKYNDLLLAALRLRFAVWGWEIDDQPRVGKSKSNKDSGEADLIVKAAGDIIALIEALILEGGNKPKTEEHIFKCPNYIPHLNQYYIIVYFKGKKENFSKTWESYKQNVLSFEYPEDIQIDVKIGFENLNDIFKNTRTFEIAMTKHKDNVEFYHVMVDFSDKNISKTKNKK